MSHPLYIAFIWHQHQPLYKSKDSFGQGNSYRLPWVRLHGTKDYLDLVLLLEKYPKLHQTFNLVPSLILQLEDYAKGTAMDPYLALTLTPEQQLTLEQKRTILNTFFDAHHRTLIDPHPRYRQLYGQRQDKGISWCLENWNLQDYSDLLAWHNLAWIDPLFQEDDQELRYWYNQQKGFTLSDRQRIIAKQRQIIERIIPQHRRMQETGQIEITTSPYTHPILPLLADTRSGRVAIPDMPLPEPRFCWSEDIARHLQKAKTIYRDRFNCQPRGLWPSEQSVSPAILADIAQARFEWLCSDEMVLGHSLQHYFHRNEQGLIAEPELLYRPYRLETPDGDLAIVFRDHRLSDLISFTYPTFSPEVAARDLISHLNAIAFSLKQRQSNPQSLALQEPWLVTIALDGENCWENYLQDGLPFLTHLYERLSRSEHLQLVTVDEFLRQFPTVHTLPINQLHSGSWIDGTFRTWIGDPIKNKAWEYLIDARQILANHPEATEENNPEAWESLYAAEGSDWFWWFGEGNSSRQDEIFDQLFREHLCTLYRSLNETIPGYLYHPLESYPKKGKQVPEGFIHPVIDGIGDEEDWEKAGRIELGAKGAMIANTLVRCIFYGFNHQYLYFRLDFKSGVKIGQGLPNELHLFWYYPGSIQPNCPVPLAHVPEQPPVNYYFHHHLGINLQRQTTWLEEVINPFQWHPRPCQAKVAFQSCLEIAIPWSDLHKEPDTVLHLLGILAEQGEYHSMIPEESLILLTIP